MAGISSKAAGKTENKKKYDGYELNSDFDINIYESFYRSHDPQLGRFWQLDPKPNEEMSLYSAMSNNPILYSDPMGDTSLYYNNQGVQIGAVNRGNGVTAVEVGDKMAGFVGLAANAINGNKDLNDKQVAALDGLLQTTGVAYDASSFGKFYDDNQSIPATKIGNENTKDLKNISFNDKPITPKAEVYGDLTLKNGVVTVSHNKPTSTGEFTSGVFGDSQIGEIHTHPIAEDGKLKYDYKVGGVNSGGGGGSMHAGPSPDDYANSSFEKYRSVVVDSKNIYLYKQGQPPIIIPRK